MKVLMTTLLLFLSSVALAHNCPNEMKAIDAELRKTELTGANLEKVKDLRSQGEKAHTAGKHDDSMKALGEAKKMLGI
jgi:hypothetical protein